MHPNSLPLVPHLRAHRTENTTGRRMNPPLSGLLQDVLTDQRKLKDVATTFVQLRGDLDLTYEGFRLRLEQGRIHLDDLPAICEAMSLHGIDPSPYVATLEMACVPRDLDLDGTMLDELVEMTAALGDYAEHFKKHGSDLSAYPNDTLRAVMSICNRTQAAVRRLGQECLNSYEG